MDRKFVQLIPVEFGVGGPRAFYALDESGWVWYGTLEESGRRAAPAKIHWRRIEHTRQT